MPRSLEPGELVERYRVESVLGEGGAARVYRVRHTTLGTVHALKVLTVDPPTLRKRLIAEGKAQAQLSHPNLVPVRDVLELEDGPALLMDFVPGQTLRHLLKAGAMRPAAALDMFLQIAEGVGYAHSQGLYPSGMVTSMLYIGSSRTGLALRNASLNALDPASLNETSSESTGWCLPS